MDNLGISDGAVNANEARGMDDELKDKQDDMSKSMDKLDISLSNENKEVLRKYLEETFGLLCQNGIDEKLDVTYLKYLMHNANLHEDNPALFKRINDLSKYGEFLTQWTKEEFVAFFMNEDKQRSLKTV